MKIIKWLVRPFLRARHRAAARESLGLSLAVLTLEDMNERDEARGYLDASFARAKKAKQALEWAEGGR